MIKLQTGLGKQYRSSLIRVFWSLFAIPLASFIQNILQFGLFVWIVGRLQQSFLSSEILGTLRQTVDMIQQQKQNSVLVCICEGKSQLQTATIPSHKRLSEITVTRTVKDFFKNKIMEFIFPTYAFLLPSMSNLFLNYSRSTRKIHEPVLFLNCSSWTHEVLELLFLNR